MLVFHVSELRSKGRMDSYVHAQNRARAGGRRVAFFLGNAVGIRHAHTRLGPVDDGVKSARMQPRCAAHGGGFLSHRLLMP